MSKEQIEQMARFIVENTDLSVFDIAENIAQELYNAGYRKQSVGEWEKRTAIIFDSELIGYRCTECNTTWNTPTNYCPNCGAKMKGGAE